MTEPEKYIRTGDVGRYGQERRPHVQAGSQNQENKNVGRPPDPKGSGIDTTTNQGKDTTQGS